MIGTIRKHSGWLWAVIITATIISFVFWGASSSRMGVAGGGGAGNLGTVYGKKVTPEAYTDARNNFILSYWFRTGTWPDKSSMTPDEMKQQIYLSLMLAAKAEKLGIHINDDAAAAAAAERLQSIGRNGQAVPLDALIQQALGPQGFTAADFEKYVRNDLMIQELVQALGLPGELITPQQVAAAYEHDHQELACQIVFFNASNYISSVTVSPAIIGQFYTNYQAEYRLPDRVQINYAVFDATNYLAKSRAEWAKTNLTEIVEADLQKVGETYRGAKSPAEARAKITEELVEGRALGMAKKDAYEFASAVFAIDPPKADSLATVASKMGVTVHQTAPFAKSTGPDELESSANFTKAAFELTPEIPVAGPVADGNALYVIALAKTLPSTIPPFEQLRFQVAMDYQHREATLMAQRAGESFYRTLTNQMAAGRAFSTVCAGAGCKPVALPAFSIGTQQLPELGEQVSLAEVKQAAFTTPVGKPSPFETTGDGGFVLFVQSKLPIDQTAMNADLPQFTAGLRRARQSEAFNQWLQVEATGSLVIPK